LRRRSFASLGSPAQNHSLEQVAARALKSPASGEETEIPLGQAPVTFDAVYAEYARFVWRSLARLGVAEAQLSDATQEVFIVVHRRLGEFEQRSSLKTWLFGIAMRVASQARRDTRRRPSEPLAGDVLDPLGSPHEDAERAEAARTLYRLLEELSPEQRALFVLVELEQMTLPDAAEAVSANLHTAASRLKTARRKFESALKRHRARDERRRP
jgi:RNA polymerase sigma-70 factor (ECF subfamily)